LIRDYPETIRWTRNRKGFTDNLPYSKAEHAVQLQFDAAFGDAEKVFGLRGMRRALIAYWADALADLRERSVNSTYARYHSYDAVAELLRYKNAQNVFDAAIKPSSSLK
jgi:hypothetical protein